MTYPPGGDLRRGWAVVVNGTQIPSEDLRLGLCHYQNPKRKTPKPTEDPLKRYDTSSCSCDYFYL